ncbi:MAG TPA: OstA-like protein, partial [Chitinophagaceae bacterium]|nr:OstA-like protein [Chitinophagaceae bacterium]
MMRSLPFILCCFLLALTEAVAQAPVDTTRRVDILPGSERFYLRRSPTGEDLQILAGNVRLRQGTALFHCDSCVYNPAANLLEAFGRVHINDADTAHVYSNYLRYTTDTKKAFFRGNVRMTDGRATLTTPEL